MELSQVFTTLRCGAENLAKLNSAQKNSALLSVAKSIKKFETEILKANSIDVELFRKNGVAESLTDRLLLNEKRIDDIVESINIVASCEDPIGSVVSGWTTLEGLKITQVRVPIGVAAIIYENRPNVTAEAFAIAYKSGNAILLRGSSSALNSNKAIVSAITDGLENAFYRGQKVGVSQAVALAQGGNREEVDMILEAKGKIDIVLPRGSAKFIQTVVEKARVPVIETGSGVCHIFVDESADLEKAVLIAENAKIQRPGVCNAMETLLVHENIAEKFLPLLLEKFSNRVQLRCDEKSFKILNKIPFYGFGDGCSDQLHKKTNIVAAVESDFGYEFLDNIVAVKIVASVEEAIKHINSHNTKHSESILTENINNAKKFQTEIDASCVYVNSSTRFTDGGVFGFGAELGISTQKFHVRGPMGLTALTTTKYLIEGNGNIRL